MVSAQSSFKIIVHPENPTTEVSSEELSDIFLKKSINWADGINVEPVDLAAASSLRESFSEQVHGRTTASVVAYHNKKIFSGQGKPPLMVASDAEVIDFVSRNRGSVGYVSRATALDGVRSLSLVTLPVRISHVQPRYTEGARRARLSGEVILEVVVAADGSISDVSTIKGLGMGLTKEATNAVKKWKYLPASKDGVAIETTITVTLRF